MSSFGWTKQEYDDSAAGVVMTLLKYLKIKATYLHVKDTVLRHPDYPSLLALSESLAEWGLRTEGVSGEVSDLSEVDYPSIVHLKSREFAVLEDITDNRATISGAFSTPRTLSLDRFGEIWDGVLLRVFAQDSYAEADFERHHRAERLESVRQLIIWFGFPLLYGIAFAYGLWGHSLWSLLTSLGLVSSIGFLLCAIMSAATLGKPEMLNALCPRKKAANCHKVMQSPAARVFEISMAELGLVYFATWLVSLPLSMFTGNLQAELVYLGALAALSLPYTLFSITYQAFVIRSWCWMCLVIQALFWMQFLLLHDISAHGLAVNPFSQGYPVAFSLGFGFTVLGWISLRSLLTGSRRAERLDYQVSRLRRQPGLVQQQLRSTDRVEIEKFASEVEIGSASAGLTLTVVVNPMCRHCWKVFNELDRLIENHPGRIKAYVRFLVSPKPDEQTETDILIDREVSLRVLALAHNGGLAQVHQALKAWFTPSEVLTKRRFDRWSQDFPFDGDEDRHHSETMLRRHYDWSRGLDIEGTPTVFIDGIRLPIDMQLDDLKYFWMRKFQN